MSTSFNLAWRLFRHEARRGELTIILLAIVLIYLKLSTEQKSHLIEL